MAVPVPNEVPEPQDIIEGAQTYVPDLGTQRVFLQVIAGAGIMTLTADANAVNAIFDSSLRAWPDAPADLFKFAAQVKQLTQTA